MKKMSLHEYVMFLEMLLLQDFTNVLPQYLDGYQENLLANRLLPKMVHSYTTKRRDQNS